MDETSRNFSDPKQTPSGRRKSRAREVDSTGHDQKSGPSSQIRDDLDESPDNVIPIPPKRQPELKIDTEDLQRPKPKSSIAQARESRRKMKSGPLPNSAMAIFSPGGDDKVFIDPSDIQDFNDDEPDEVSQRALESGNTRTISTTFKGAGNDQGPTVVTTTSNKNADLILVQERNRFRRKTKQDLIFDAIIKSELEDNDIQEVGDTMMEQFLDSSRLAIILISYLSYGIAAGLGIYTLITYPVFPPEVEPENGFKFQNDILLDMMAYVKSPLVIFLSYYSSYASSVSSTFCLVSTFALLHGLDTRYKERSTRERLLKQDSEPITKNSKILTLQQKEALQKRGVATAVLLVLTWILFLSSIMVSFSSENFYAASISPSLRRNGAVPNTIGFRAAAYSSNLDPKTSNLAASNFVTIMDWYWYEIVDAIATQKAAKLSASFEFDMSWFCAWNIIRGLSAVLAFVAALIEIKFRSLQRS